MIEQLKKLWQLPSPESLALRELEDARRKLLEAQTTREYATAMCAFRESQIRRLTAFIREIQ